MKFYPGDTISLEVPTDLVGTCNFQFSGPTAITEKAATPSAGGYSLTLTTSQTNSLTAGEYFYRAYVTVGSDKTTVLEGSFFIKVLGQKSNNKIALEAIEAALLRQASREQLKVYVGKTQIEYMTHEQLISARAKLQALVDAEARQENGKQSFGTKKIYIQF